jgi:hypothetical protein
VVEERRAVSRRLRQVYGATRKRQIDAAKIAGWRYRRGWRLPDLFPAGFRSEDAEKLIYLFIGEKKHWHMLNVMVPNKTLLLEADQLSTMFDRASAKL